MAARDTAATPAGQLSAGMLYLFLSLYLVLLAFFILIVSTMSFDSQRVSDALNSLDRSFSMNSEILPWRQRADETLGADTGGAEDAYDRIRNLITLNLDQARSHVDDDGNALHLYLQKSEIFDAQGRMTRQGVYALDGLGDELRRSQNRADSAGDLVLTADIVGYHSAGEQATAINDVTQLVERLAAINAPTSAMTIAIAPTPARRFNQGGIGPTGREDIEIRLRYERADRPGINPLAAGSQDISESGNGRRR